MKKIIALSAIVASLFAADYQFGAGFGRNGVKHTQMKNYNFANIRVDRFLPKNHILRAELERSTSIKIPGIDKDTSLTRALLNVEHYFTLKNTKLTPYAFIGGGYQWVKGVYDNSAVADLGVGIRYPVYKTLNFFAEARGLRDFHNNDNHWGFIGGLVFNFGGEKPAPIAKPVEEKPKIIDSDGDGVPDNLDKCPNTPKGIKVDKNGCAIDSDGDGVPDYLDKCPNTPRGVKVDKNGCATDSDGDGVPDYLDKCPNTPRGVKVDKNGCAIDSDGDGVPDYLDKCPNTLKGMEVNQNGCAISYNFGINFDNDSLKIKPQYLQKIEKFAEFLKKHPNVKAEIQGYTDNKGSEKYNLTLSKKRAKALNLV